MNLNPVNWNTFKGLRERTNEIIWWELEKIDYTHMQELCNCQRGNQKLNAITIITHRTDKSNGIVQVLPYKSGTHVDKYTF